MKKALNDPNQGKINWSILYHMHTQRYSKDIPKKIFQRRTRITKHIAYENTPATYVKTKEVEEETKKDSCLMKIAQ